MHSSDGAIGLILTERTVAATSRDETPFINTSLDKHIEVVVDT